MINRVVLVGRVTKDVEVRKTTSGLSVAQFTVACNRRQSANSPERQADFINCVAWRQTADFMSQYCKKGSLVGVEGRIQTRNYDNAEGRRVYVTEVICDSVQLLARPNQTGAPVVNNAQPSMNNTYPADDFANNAFDDNGFDDFTSGVSLDISSDDLPF